MVRAYESYTESNIVGWNVMSPHRVFLILPCANRIKIVVGLSLHALFFSALLIFVYSYPSPYKVRNIRRSYQRQQIQWATREPRGVTSTTSTTSSLEADLRRNRNPLAPGRQAGSARLCRYL